MLAPPTPLSARTTRPGPAARPFSIRLTETERRSLLERAGKLPLGAFIRDLILAESLRTRRRRTMNPVKDCEALARVLAALGQSRIANNLSQLAKAMNIGALPMTPETESEIVAACAAVIAMRGELMRRIHHTFVSSQTGGKPMISGFTASPFEIDELQSSMTNIVRDMA